MKRILFVSLLLFVLLYSGVFADSVTGAQYNKKDQLNLTGVVGLNLWGLSVGVGAEKIMGELDFIPEFPMEWGIAARGLFGLYLFSGYTGIDYGAAPLATLHKGFNFGDKMEFDFTFGLGLGLYGYSYGYSYGYYDYKYTEPIKLGLASFDSVSWKMKKDFWLTLEYAYVGWQSVYGFGVRLVK